MIIEVKISIYISRFSEKTVYSQPGKGDDHMYKHKDENKILPLSWKKKKVEKVANGYGMVYMLGGLFDDSEM